MPADNQLLTEKEVAELLGYSTKRLQAARISGDLGLPFVQLSARHPLSQVGRGCLDRFTQVVPLDCGISAPSIGGPPMKQMTVYCLEDETGTPFYVGCTSYANRPELHIKYAKNESARGEMVEKEQSHHPHA